MDVAYFSMNTDLTTCTGVKAKIAKIDQIIDQLLTTAMKSVATGNHAEYKVDDGQSVTNVIYRSPKEITDTVIEYRRIRQMYVNDLIGHQFKQVDGRNLNGRNY